MLIELTIQNFRSVGTQCVLSLVASPDRALETNVLQGDYGLRSNLKLLRSVLMYGANASGKSNICQALFYMRLAVVDSATKLNEGDNLHGIEPFAFASEFASEPSSFEVAVSLRGDIYRYGFRATKSTIVAEWLYLTRKARGSREVMLFNRISQDKSLWEFGASFRGNREHLIERTRATNCLLLSRAAQESYKQLTPLYNWFRHSLNVANMTQIPNSPILMEAQRCHDSSNRCSALTSLARIADSSVAETKTTMTHIEVPPSARDAMAAENPELPPLPAEIDIAEFTFGRRKAASNEVTFLDFDQESNGTKKFFGAATMMAEAFEHGQTLVLDELECSLHPLLMRQLISTMNDPVLGESGAQFIVATHDTSVFDFDLLRRDQLFLVEKSPSHETDLYSVYDLNPRPRGDAAAEKQYLSERFGGTPKLGDLRGAIAQVLSARANGKQV